MFKNLRRKFARLLDPDYFREADLRVNQRVAAAMNEMDPFEPLMKEFHGIFSQDWTHPEDKLNEQGQLTMKMWAYGQSSDPHFKHLTEWIMNTQGNAMLKAPARTNDERGEILMWGKAQISSMVLFVKEIGRLSSLYQEILDKGKDPNFESDLTVE